MAEMSHILLQNGTIEPGTRFPRALNPSGGPWTTTLLDRTSKRKTCLNVSMRNHFGSSFPRALSTNACHGLTVYADMRVTRHS